LGAQQEEVFLVVLLAFLYSVFRTKSCVGEINFTNDTMGRVYEAT